MTIKEKDFIEVEYTGIITESGDLFDTTNEALAKEKQLRAQHSTFGPVIICVGEGYLLKALELALVGKELGEHTINLEVEEAFGKKNPKLLNMIPSSKLTKQGIKPVPGLTLNMDGYMGTIKNVSGGRTIIDFNHPLSGKAITYKIQVNKVITDKKKQLVALTAMFGLPEDKIKEKEGKYGILTEHTVPEPAKELIKKKIKELTNIDITFENDKPLNSSEEKPVPENGTGRKE